MSELLQLVLTDETARGDNARKVAAAKATDSFAPWGPGLQDEA